MKTHHIALAAAPLLLLAACGQHNDTANVSAADTGTNVEGIDDAALGTDNVVLPEENATDLNAAAVDPALLGNGSGNAS